MNTRHKIGFIFFGLMILALSLVVVNHLIVYAGTPYEISIIRSHLALSSDTHNIEAKVGYIDSTIQKLAPYQGNSEWWFPREATNIDETKALLKTVSNDVKEQLGVKERENYFILPHNELMTYLNTEIDDAGDRLSHYQHGAYWNPANNIGWYILVPMGLISFPLMIIFWAGGEDRGYQKRCDKKEDEKRLKKEAEEKKEEDDKATLEREAIRKDSRGSLPKNF